MSTTEVSRGQEPQEETEDERANRRWQERIQEIRVTRTGVQILFGFLFHTVVREAMAAALAPEADLAVTGQADSLAQARSGSYSGDLIAELRDINPHAEALMLTASRDRAALAKAVETGAAAVLDKTAQLHHLTRPGLWPGTRRCRATAGGGVSCRAWRS
ncbi:DUF6328 family protein [Actinacidiphila soli]|uniref:DUF6328 family protein n=1 Tax=Actinacidiphila soli TaxID=2487275 RepID=UPI000FCB63E6|nr:DUF6328 family protein [Actinacidiphila soli]